jgi:hypothetical protein
MEAVDMAGTNTENETVKEEVFPEAEHIDRLSEGEWNDQKPSRKKKRSRKAAGSSQNSAGGRDKRARTLKR